MCFSSSSSSRLQLPGEYRWVCLQPVSEPRNLLWWRQWLHLPLHVALHRWVLQVPAWLGGGGVPCDLGKWRYSEDSVWCHSWSPRLPSFMLFSVWGFVCWFFWCWGLIPGPCISLVLFCCCCFHFFTYSSLSSCPFLLSCKLFSELQGRSSPESPPMLGWTFRWHSHAIVGHPQGLCDWPPPPALCFTLWGFKFMYDI